RGTRPAYRDADSAAADRRDATIQPGGAQTVVAKRQAVRAAIRPVADHAIADWESGHEWGTHGERYARLRGATGGPRHPAARRPHPRRAATVGGSEVEAARLCVGAEIRPHHTAPSPGASAAHRPLG